MPSYVCSYGLRSGTATITLQALQTMQIYRYHHWLVVWSISQAERARRGVRTVQLTKITKSMKNKFKRSFSDDIHEDQLDHPYENQGKTLKRFYVLLSLRLFSCFQQLVVNCWEKIFKLARWNQGGRISMRFATNIIQRWASRFFAHFVLSSAGAQKKRKRRA
jgi:hypothetical protein